MEERTMSDEFINQVDRRAALKASACALTSTTSGNCHVRGRQSRSGKRNG
jgi:hypothetical protein